MNEFMLGAYTIAAVLIAAWFWRRKFWFSFLLIMAAGLLNALYGKAP